MTPDEILDRLKLNNAKIARKTLYNWEKAGVIPAAIFRNSRTAEYPPETFAQAYTAYTFTQEGINVPVFNFKVKVALDAVIDIRKVYEKITKVATERRLSPWDNDADLEKAILSLAKEETPKIVIQLMYYHGIFYWPKQYHIHIQKAMLLE